MPSYPIYLSEEIHKPFALSRVFLLSSGGESAVLAKKKTPSRSGFLRSMHVVLKTRYVNPNIHVRRFIVQVRSPNLSATRPQFYPYTEQQPNIGSLIDQYRFTPHTTMGSHSSPPSEGSTHSYTLYLPLIAPRSRVHSLQQLVPSVARTLTPSGMERKIWGAFPWKVVSLPARLNI